MATKYDRVDWRVGALVLLVLAAVEFVAMPLIRGTFSPSPLADDVLQAVLLAALNAPIIRHTIRHRVALARELERLRADTLVASVLQVSPDGVITTDFGGAISQFNAGAEALFGYFAHEILGENLSTILPGLPPSGGAEGDARIDPDARRFSVTWPAVQIEAHRKDGTSFVAEVTVAGLGHGDDTMFTAVVRDTTERTRMHQSRVASDERYRSLFANMPSGLAYCRIMRDADNKPADFEYLAVNAAFERITGMRNVVGKRGSDVALRAREQTPELLATFERVAATMVPETFHSDFHLFGKWLNIAVYSPALGTFVAVFDDITERKRLEAERALQSAALNSAVNPIVITDRDGTIVWVNSAFARSTGYIAEEVIGRNPRALFKSGVHDDAFYANLWETVLRGDVWEGEMTNRRKDGTLYPEMQTITPVRDAHGEISHFIAIKRDLTAEKKLQAQFLQSQKMETVGRLAGGVAHDFNNLLMVMNGWTEMTIADLPDAHPARASLAEVLSAGEGAARLTRQLLAFSRQQVVERSVFSVNALVADLEKMLRRLLGEDIALVCRSDPALGFVRADRGQLEQVLMNLAVNARDAMPQGGSLLVETANVTLPRDSALPAVELPPGEYITLAVGDTGTGMSDAVRAHVFEPFFTTKPAGQGTGLGLATTFGIVRQAGGAIDIATQLGMGTTMTIYIPRTYETPRPASPRRAKLKRQGVETVLLVEDETAVGDVTSRMLELRGYRVLRASSGDEALSLARTLHEPLHLLLTDVVLSANMGGYQLAEQLSKQRPEMKLLYMSGYTQDVTLLHGLPEQEGALLQKPFTGDALVAKVRQVLDEA